MPPRVHWEGSVPWVPSESQWRQMTSTAPTGAEGDALAMGYSSEALTGDLGSS